MTACVSDRCSGPAELPSCKWKEKDSYLQRAELQSAALPLELSFHFAVNCSISRFSSNSWLCKHIRSFPQRPRKKKTTRLYQTGGCKIRNISSFSSYTRSTWADKSTTNDPVFNIATKLDILCLLIFSYHFRRSHCFFSPYHYVLSSGSRLWTGSLWDMSPAIFQLIISF